MRAVPDRRSLHGRHEKAGAAARMESEFCNMGKISRGLAVLWLVIFVLSLSLSLGGCATKRLSEDEFTYIMATEVTSLDPQTASSTSEVIAIRHLFEGLCRLDETGQSIPGAARKWSSNEDHTVFTFTLRSNSSWNDGETPLTSYDYLYGIQRALDPVTKADGLEDLFIIKNAEEINNGAMDMDSLGIETPDEKTITFYLENSYANFPRLTAGLRYMPCNEEFFQGTIGKYGLDFYNTLTNGPFNFSSEYSWEKDSGKTRYLSIGRASKYTGDQTAVPLKITFYIDRDSTIAENDIDALVNGQLDLAELQEDELDSARSRGCQTITLNDSICGLLLNVEDDLLRHTSIREVFMKTINRPDIIARLTESTQEAHGIVPPCVTWEGRPYRDLSDSMYPAQNLDIVYNIPSILDTLELETEALPSISVICPDDENSKNLANGIVVSWNSQLSNSFNLEPLPLKEFEARVENGSYQAALYSLQATGTTPNAFFGKFSRTAFPKLLDDEDYDSMLNKNNFSFDSYKALEQYILDTYVFYPIYYTYSYYGISPKAVDVEVTPDLGICFINAYKKE